MVQRCVVLGPLHPIKPTSLTIFHLSQLTLTHLTPLPIPTSLPLPGQLHTYIHLGTLLNHRTLFILYYLVYLLNMLYNFP